jgi:Tol biopolymer transport system component
VSSRRAVACLALFFSTLYSGAWALDYPGGQQPPAAPALLAPGLINSGPPTRDVAMTPDGKEFYFCQHTPGHGYGAILVTRRTAAGWSEPEVAPFSGDPRWMDLEPAISPDGRRFFFYSNRPAQPGGEAAQDLWVMDRVGDGWGEPRNLGAPVNTDGAEFFPSVTHDGTLYFCRAEAGSRLHRLYRSRLVAGRYQEPELLPEQANAGRNRFNAWMSPDETRLVVPVAGHPDNHGGVDYWLAVRDGQDTWSGPFNLGPVINDGSGGAWSPFISPDGAAFLFMSSRPVGPPPPWPGSWVSLQRQHLNPAGGKPAIFWVDAGFLDRVAAGQPAGLDDGQTIALPVKPGSSWPRLHGPYLGQNPPGLEPEIFAPGLVSTGLNERDIIISPDGGTIYFGLMDQGQVTVMVTRLVDGAWSMPVTAPFHEDPEFACFEPSLSADGRWVYFLANKAAPDQEQGRGWATQNIWRSRKGEDGWQPAEAVPAPVTSDRGEYFPSLAADGTLYFSRENEEGQPFLWKAEPSGQGFADPVRLPAAVNVGQACYNAFVAPDESFIISCVNGHEKNLGRADYWISVSDGKGGWRPARNLGPLFNGEDRAASSAYLSPDGRYLFFSSNRAQPFSGDRLTRADLERIHAGCGNGAGDIWWVSAEVLQPFLE